MIKNAQGAWRLHTRSCAGPHLLMCELVGPLSRLLMRLRRRHAVLLPKLGGPGRRVRRTLHHLDRAGAGVEGPVFLPTVFLHRSGPAASAELA